MINVSAFPRCAKRLEINLTKLSDPLMTEYWAAVIVADFCDDEALTDFGGFNFDDRSAENGIKLLQRLEDCIRQKKHRVPRFQPSNSLVALLGARGVRTSCLKSEEDYWTASETMFPGHIDRFIGSTIEAQITAIAKKARKALGDQNLRNLPHGWISPAPAHQAKLQRRAA